MEKLPKIEKPKSVKRKPSKALLTAAAISIGSISPQEAGHFKAAKAETSLTKNSKKTEMSAPVKKGKKSKKDYSYEQGLEDLEKTKEISKEEISSEIPYENPTETQNNNEPTVEAKKEITVPFSVFVESIRDSIGAHSNGEISVKNFEIKKSGSSFEINADLKAWGLFTINISGKIINGLKSSPGGTALKTLEISDLKIDASRIIRKKAEDMVKTNLALAIPYLIDQLKTQYQTSIAGLEIDESGNLILIPGFEDAQVSR